MTEDLATPGAPIIFSSAAGAELYRVTKNEAVPQTSNASFGASLTPPVGLPRVLAEGGVALLPGTDFGPAGQGFLRLSYVRDMATLEEGMARLKRVLAAVRAERSAL